MLIAKFEARNWRNFKKLDVNLKDRMFFVGPNAAGKSNLLDIFKFLHDVAKQRGGGLQQAISDRGGVSKIRCLATRKSPDIIISVTLVDTSAPGISNIIWKYELAITQEIRGQRLPIVRHEKVWKNGTLILDRPNPQDKGDVKLLTQTHLEQINANKDFRDIAEFLQSILYLHLVPQVIRHPEMFPAKQLSEDPYGINFLKRIAETPKKVRDSRLRKIEKVLNIAVPQLKELSYTTDSAGVSHLEAVYKHWRPRGARQREDQFSDGTLRFIGFLWALLEGNSLLLLEEPELSLNSAIVTKIPSIIYRIARVKKRQIFVTTHSSDLLMDSGVAPEEVVVLKPSSEGTETSLAASITEIKALIRGGMSMAEIIIPRTYPEDIAQLKLFELDA